MKAIVIYNSQTGFTKRYAEWISEELGGDLKELSSAKKMDLSGYDAVIYGGWALGGTVSKLNWFKENMKNWQGKKLAVFCVGASPEENPELGIFLKNTREQLENTGVFYCQGGMSYEKMSGGYKLMMKMFVKMLKSKKDKTEADEMQIKMISSSYDISDRKYIRPIVEYIKG